MPRRVHERSRTNPASASIPRASSVRAFPAVAESGMVFVWFGDAARADVSDIPLPARVRAYGAAEYVVTRRFSEVLPYWCETLVETNAEHVHQKFAHRGMTPSMNCSVSFDMNRTYEMLARSAPGGAVSGAWGVFQLGLVPPAYVEYSARLPGLLSLHMLFHMSPAGVADGAILRFRGRMYAHRDSISLVFEDVELPVEELMASRNSRIG